MGRGGGQPEMGRYKICIDERREVGMEREEGIGGSYGGGDGIGIV